MMCLGAFVALMSTALSPAQPATARYVVKAVTTTWEPITLTAVEQMIEERSVPGLTKVGGLRLEKSSYADLKSGDFVITMDARFVEEAEKLSVYFTFGPGKRQDFASYHVSETVDLGGLRRADMQARIEALAERAAKRLADLLAQILSDSARTASVLPASPLPPWVWGDIDVPRIASPSKLIEQLIDVRNEDHVRAKAAAEIAPHVFDQDAARHAIQRCALADPTPGIRADCVRYLVPVARTNVPTQRILLHALRSEVDEQVQSELSAVSMTFVGLSRKESIESWLELIATEATPPEAARAVAELLSKEDAVPNLELAVAKCLELEALIYGKKQACAQWLLGKIPEARRFAVARRYLERVSVYEQGEENTYTSVLEHVAGRGRKKLQAELSSMLLEIASRPSAGRARSRALYELGRAEAPDRGMMDRVIALVREPETAIAALRTIRDFVRTTPDLRTPAVEALRNLKGKASFLTPPSRQDPMEELDKTIEALARE